MADKKAKTDKAKGKPSTTNDQLGENAGEGRIIKENTKGGKCR
jgi:hypothetical protein